MPLTDGDHIDNIDYAYNKKPKCPKCDEEIDISATELFELYDEGEHVIACPHCETSITIQTEIEYTFSTDEQPESFFETKKS